MISNYIAIFRLQTAACARGGTKSCGLFRYNDSVICVEMFCDVLKVDELMLSTNGVYTLLLCSFPDTTK